MTAANKKEEWKLIFCALEEGDIYRLRALLKENDINTNELRKRFTRKQTIDAMLAAEGITPDGNYYRECINGEVEIDITEFRFRHYVATTCASEYAEIVMELRDDNGSFYSDIHTDARERIAARLYQRGIGYEIPMAEFFNPTTE